MVITVQRIGKLIQPFVSFESIRTIFSTEDEVTLLVNCAFRILDAVLGAQHLEKEYRITGTQTAME